MDKLLSLSEMNINKEEDERQNKILTLITETETNFIDTRRELYKLLDEKFKPQIVDVSFKDGFGTVNILDKSDIESFTLDRTDREKMINKISEIINSKIDIEDTQDYTSFENVTGGRIYKYRHRNHKYGSGLRTYDIF